MQWFPLALAVAVDIGCGHAAPPPLHSEGGGPSASSAVPAGPWSISYSDGSGNTYEVASDVGGATFSYDPMTPAESSSGTYSGGEPRSGRLDAATIEQLWTRVRALEAEAAREATERAMTTGAFSVSEGGLAERSFVVQPSAALAAFDRFVSGL
jgi:hypothetical protein